MAINSISVILNIKMPEAKKDIEECLSSIESVTFADFGKADLLIMEVGFDPDNEFNEITRIKENEKVSEIFLTSSSDDPRLLIRAIRSGIKEFFPQPIVADELKRAVQDCAVRLGSTKKPEVLKKGKIITVAGARGGIGTSTIAVNLAASLNALEGVESVAILDLLPVFGDSSIFLDITQPQYSWLELVNNLSRMDKTYLMSTIARHDSGIYVMTAPLQRIEDPDASLTEKISMLLDILRRNFDFIVVDNGKSLDRISMTFLKESDQILIVSVLNLPCVSSSRRLLDYLRNSGIFQSEVIINRVEKNSLISINDAEKAFGRKALAMIPNDYRTAVNSLNQGKPLNVVAQGTDIAKSIQNIAMLITGRTEKPKEKGGILKRFGVFN